MKRLTTGICLLLICLNGCAAENSVSENPFRIKTSVTEFPSRDTIILDFHYNEMGLLDKEEQTVNGEPDSTTYFAYDEWGNTVRKTTYHADGTELIVEHLLILDEDHRIISTENYSNTELTDCLETTYDKKGNPVTRINTIVRQGKDEIITSQMTYDRSGNLIKRVVQWSNDPSMGGTTTYSYENDRLTREDCFAPAGWLESYIEYNYDDSGLIQTCVEYNGNGIIQSKTVIHNDEYDNVMRHEYYSYRDRKPDSGEEIADRITTCTYEIIPYME